jgi:alcohol dehydrogenase
MKSIARTRTGANTSTIDTIATPKEQGELMRALVFHGPNLKSWDKVPKPVVIDDTDAIVRVEATTICGSDLHILKGDVPETTPGRILGHEAVGTVESVGKRNRSPKSSALTG